MKHIRTAAIIQHKDKILLHSAQNENYWTLPGGAVEEESTKEGLIREMMEELGEAVEIKELKIIAENQFFYRGNKIDSVEFYYQVELLPESRLIEKESFVRTEAFGQFGDQPYELMFKWFNLNQLDNLVLLPAFLATELQQMEPNQMKHIEQLT